MMKKPLRILAALAALALTAHCAQARSLDTVGQCPLGASMRYASAAPYAGQANALLALPAFAKRHALAAQGEAPWLENLSGRSGRNRLYREGAHQVIVLTVCNPADCDGNRVSIGFEPASGAYFGRLYEGRHVRELGGTPEELAMQPDAVSHAVTCAQNLDWETK